MTHFKNKSDFNIEASNILIERTLYAPSIHCIYYGCLQLIMHILRQRFKYTEYAISSGIQDFKNRKRGGTHVYYINEIYQIVAKSDKRTATDLYSNLTQLKVFREDSDYKNNMITIDQSKKAIDYKNSVIQVLNKL